MSSQKRHGSQDVRSVLAVRKTEIAWAEIQEVERQ